MSQTYDGIQPLPLDSDGPILHDLACAVIQSRAKFGLGKYGKPLRANNGRDALQDAIDEAADLLVYLIQAKRERDAKI